MGHRLSIACLALAGCVGPLDNATVVHDLRILAIATDPPELDYPVHGDAGFTSCAPDFTPILATSSVTLRALVGDPAGQGRSLHYVFTGCPQTADGLCPSGSGYVLGEGDAPAPELDATWALGQSAAQQFLDAQRCTGAQSCAPTPLVDTFAGNPLGLCRFGVWFQIGLEVDAPDGTTIYGSKLLVFTPVPDDYPASAAVCPQGPDGGPPAHTNPTLAAFELDGEALPATVIDPVSVSGSYTLRPVEPSNGPQPYCLPLFTGGWTSLTETWLFSAMTDVGQFNREQVGGAAAIGSLETGPTTDLNFTWTFPDGGAGLTADLYEVTRDGRGGTSWLLRQVPVGP